MLEENATSTQNSKYNEEEVDFVLPKSQMILEPSMWYHALMTSSVKLDNMWLATVAGITLQCVPYIYLFNIKYPYIKILFN